MQTSFPFDAGDGAVVNEAQWQKMARRFLATGVIAGYLNELAVTADGSALSVTVATGGAWVEGFYYENDSANGVALAAANATNPRIDRIVVRLDRAANTLQLAVLQGAPAPAPVVPALTQTDALYELPLASVTVPAAAGVIVAGNVSGERYLSKNAPTRQPSLVDLVTTPSDPSLAARVTRGLPGQTGNLDEWRNDGNGLLAYMSAGGNLGVSQLLVSTGSLGAAMQAAAQAGGQITAALQGAPTQLAAILQIQSGGGSGYPAQGTPLAAFDALGRLVVRPGAGTAGLPTETGTYLEPRTNNTPAAILRGLPAQVGEIFATQESSGANLVSVRTDGMINMQSANARDTGTHGGSTGGSAGFLRFILDNSTPVYVPMFFA